MKFSLFVFALVCCAHLPGQAPTQLPTPAPELDQESVSRKNERCLTCHGQEHIKTLGPIERFKMTAPVKGREAPKEAELLALAPVRPALFIEYKKSYLTSSHQNLACVSCHQDLETLPHAWRSQRATCVECHGQEVEQHERGLHFLATSDQAGKQPREKRLENKVEERPSATCSDCHGTHDILAAKNPQSRTHKLHQARTCLQCHGKTDEDGTTAKGEDTAGKAEDAALVRDYVDSVHGRALLSGGLEAAPSCNDCHGSHEVLDSKDRRSPTYRDRINENCGRCHTKVLETIEASIHGGPGALAEGKQRPVCTDCHLSHAVTQTANRAFKESSDQRCGTCHEEELLHYRETFHGKAMALGMDTVAACYDCHGHHDILPLSEPASWLSDLNRTETCRKCHPGSSENFADYIAHADHMDREGHPALYWTFFFMTSIVLGTFLFFGIHTALWFVRSLIYYLSDREAFKRAKIQAARDKVEFVRFQPYDRFLHALVMSSFLILVFTGMPIKFYEAAWAKRMVDLVGGLDAASRLHRLGAMITFLYFALHIGRLIRKLIANRDAFKNPATGRYSPIRSIKLAFGPDSLLPGPADLRDFWGHIRWFLGRGPRPQFDRWTYWEKFDYLAVFWGVAAIGLSGLVMWFPQFFTTILPGQAINIALIIHSDEALLAAGFIFTFHFFNVHLRIEKFPIDTIIFSGRISRTEMLHERKRWHDRLVASGKLEEITVKDDWHEWRPVIRPVGFLAFGTGLVLLAMIVFAMVGRLAGG